MRHIGGKILICAGLVFGLFMADQHIKNSVRDIIAEERVQMREEVKEQAKEALHELLKDPITRRQIASVVQEGVSNSLQEDLEPAITRILERKFPFLTKKH
jgi:5-formyltetrahydrofolate cyclo-ligase